MKNLLFVMLALIGGAMLTNSPNVYGEPGQKFSPVQPEEEEVVEEGTCQTQPRMCCYVKYCCVRKRCGRRYKLVKVYYWAPCDNQCCDTDTNSGDDNAGNGLSTNPGQGALDNAGGNGITKGIQKSLKGGTAKKPKE